MNDPADPVLLAPTRTREERGLLLGRFLVGPLAVLLLALILVFYIFYAPNVVDGDSMYPSLHDRDRLLVTRGTDDPARGDVVVFELADPESGRTEGLVKRVIAVAGDTIEVRDGAATVNGVPEPQRDLIIDPRDPVDAGPYTVPPDTVFVLGDNRPASFDSRQLGPIRLSAIEGEVRWIWAPIQRFARFEPR